MTEETRSGEASALVSGSDIRTFLFADFRGYTRYTQELGDEAASALASRFADLVRETVPEFEGELLELRGDEALCVFRSARQALRASVEVQRRLRTGTGDAQAFPIGVGMGLDAGEAVPTQGGYRGTSLNLAARLCALAKPGEILATETVARFAHRVDGLRLLEGHSATLKGMPRPVRYVVVEPERPLPPAPSVPSPPPSRRKWIVVALGAILAVGAAAMWSEYRHASPQAGSTSIPIRADSLAVLNAQTGKIVRDIRMHTTPGEVTAGAKAVWLGSDSDQTITKVNPTTYEAGTPIGIGIDPAQMTVAFGSLWAYDAAADRLVSIDPTGTTSPIPKTPVPCAQKATQGCGVGGLTADSTGLWLGRCCIGSHVRSQLGFAYHVDPRSWKATPVRAVPSDRLAYGAGQLWAYGANSFFAAQISLLTYKSTPHAIPGATAVYNPLGLVVAFGSAWIVGPHTLFQYAQTGGLQHTIPIPPGAYDIAASPNRLWIVGGDGTVTQINPFTLHTRVTIHLHHAATGIASYDGRIWIPVGGAA